MESTGPVDIDESSAPPCGIPAIGQAWGFCPNGFNPTVEEGGSIPALKPARGFFGLVSNAVSC